MFNGDSYGYLANARHLAPMVWRPLGYPVLLRLVLDFAHDLTAVVAVQHVIGFALGAIVYALGRRLGLGAGLATMAATPVLFDAYQLGIEQFVMTEPLFELLALGGIALLLWHGRPSVAACAAAGGLLAAAALTRTVGLALVVPLAGYLIVRRVGLARSSAAAVAFLVPVLAYAGWFDAHNGTFSVTGRDGYFLYARVAPFAHCSALTVHPGEGVLCDPRPPALRPGPNFYLWRRASPIRRLAVRRAQTRNALLERFAGRVILHEPLAYGAAIAQDLAHYFQPFRTTGRRDEPLTVWRFSSRFPDRRRAARAIRHYAEPKRPLTAPALTTFLRAYERVVVTPGPLLAAGLAAGLLAAFGAGVAGARRGRGAAILLASAGLVLLVGAAATSMFDYRYLLPTLPLLPLAGVLGTVSLARRAHLVRERIARAPAIQETRP